MSFAPKFYVHVLRPLVYDAAADEIYTQFYEVLAQNITSTEPWLTI